jgi:hypothetical protein
VSHECPRKGCNRTVPGDMLLCAADWRKVALPLRRALYAAWDHGRGARTAAHRAAVDAVIRAVNGEPEALPGLEGRPS